MKRVLHIVGARPNYIKANPVVNAIDFAEQTVLNTGQHYDKNLSKDIVNSLNMRRPDINLSIPSDINTFERMSYLVNQLYQNVKEIKPDIVVLYGDIDSTLAGSIVASKMQIPIAHVESGLRSFDNSMPEEINRRIVDQISSLHFVTEQSGIDNLKREGHDKTIRFVGNSMIDSLKTMLESDLYLKSNYENSGNILFTCHRPSNVDNRESLEKVLNMCENIQQKIVWPVHPRTLNNMKKYGLLQNFENIKNLDLIDPLNYCDFVKMMATSRLIITDSGGIQEETTYMKIPCLTIRENTERPSTITSGSNVLVDFDEVLNMVNLVYERGEMGTEIPQLWDGNTGPRIAKNILEFLDNRN